MSRRLGAKALASLRLDMTNPIVSNVGSRIDLLFGSSRTDLLDPPYFEVELSDCGRRLTGSRLAWFPGTGVTGPFIPPDKEWPPAQE